MRLILIIACLFGSFFSFSQDYNSYIKDPNLYARERFVDFIHANISIQFKPEEGRVIGQVIHTFKPLRNGIDTLYLDGVNMEIKSITLNDQKIEHRLYKKGLTLLFPFSLSKDSSYKVNISYESSPRRGLYFIGWDDPTGLCRKQIWTQGQGLDNRHWIPMFDNMAEKMKTDILVTIDSKYKVLSNGKQIMKMKDGNGNTTWHYQMEKPHSPYLIMLGIGEYDITSYTSKSGVPIQLYSYPEWKNRIEPTYRFSKELFDFLEEEIRVPYPWGSYSQIPVQDFPYGAMENTSATVFGDFYHVDSVGYNDASYVHVNGHELAHQWFGDLVTSLTPAHHWLHESFATYYHHLAVKQFVSEDKFSSMMRDNQEAALNGTLKDFKGVGHSQSGTHRQYLKGSYVLKMLRYTVGDEDFKTGMQAYLQKHQYKNVTTDDLVAAFSESTGQSIGGFIDQWVLRGGEPNYQVDFSTIKKEKKYQIIIEQMQDTTPLVATFKMPIAFEVYYEDGTKDSSTFLVDKTLDTFYLPFSNSKISYVLFDPNSEVLKSVGFDKELKWNLNQAIKAEFMIDRFDALVALRSTSIKKKEKTLHTVLARTQYHRVRVEAMKQLLKEEKLTNDEIKIIINSNDPGLQKAFLQNSGNFDEELKEEYEKLLSANSYEVIELALVRLCSSFREDIPAYLDQTYQVYGVRGNNVRIQWLEIKYLTTESYQAVAELIDMTSNSYEFITRLKAISTLKRLNYCDDKLVKNLSLGVQKANWKLAGASGNLLKHFYNEADYKEVVSSTVKSMNLSEEERKRVDRFLVEFEKK